MASKWPVRVLTWLVRVITVVPLWAAYGLGPVVITTLLGGPTSLLITYKTFQFKMLFITYETGFIAMVIIACLCKAARFGSIQIVG